MLGGFAPVLGSSCAVLRLVFPEEAKLLLLRKENLAHYDAKASRGQRCCGLTDGWVCAGARLKLRRKATAPK